MNKISSIRDLVNLWPKRADLANDLVIELASMGITHLRATEAQVHKWAEKGSIPPKYHRPLIRAGKRRGLRITANLIVALHTPERDAA